MSARILASRDEQRACTSAARPLPLPKATGANARARSAVDPYADSNAPRWLKYLWRHLAGAPRLRARARARLPLRRHAVLHLPGGIAIAGPRRDRAVADLHGRLRRHRLVGADDGGRHRRLCNGGARHEQQRRDQPGLAVVGGGAVCAADRRRLRHLHRLAVGAHRWHLHDHDHAGHRRGLLLPGAAELQRLQRLPGPARAEAAHGVRHQLA